MIQKQRYITDRAYPYWIIYRDAFFDRISKKNSNVFVVSWFWLCFKYAAASFALSFVNGGLPTTRSYLFVNGCSSVSAWIKFRLTFGPGSYWLQKRSTASRITEKTDLKGYW